MIIEIKKLCALKKFTGAFDFEYTPPEDICIIPLCKVEGDVRVTGTFEIYDDDTVGVEMTVKYLLKGQCSYCLSDAEKQITFSQQVDFVTYKDDDNYNYDGVRLNLKPAVDDAILISQPNVLLCKEDCKGIV